MKIRDIAHLDRREGMYALFGTDGYLSLAQAGGPPVRVIHLPGIRTQGQIRLYVREPWVCVTERFGAHAALVHLEDASVREMSREDYHANVSSYSIGFLERGGRVLLIHQTEWNRLDILDAATGECLTDREVYARETASKGEGEEWLSPGLAAKNYIDYFHSLLHVSPDGEHFLSNGWMWHPLGQILRFRTGDFLERYELSKLPIECCQEYNWDRPCAFIGGDRFVIATDDARNYGSLDEEELKDYAYRQLQFYRLDGPVHEDEDGERTLKKEREAACDAFVPDEDGHVHGALYWDAARGFLVALTPGGAFALNLDGEVLEFHPECRCADGAAIGPGRSPDPGWRYSPEHHRLYHWSQSAGAVEERQFDCAGG